ncbi:MAG: shikimate kinase [Coriobacteriaceae bacterium]|nr:shikimate kinase [Coriobacteriaceae bacterium]MDD7430684.1 shikimate kinase [Coriobacteriaceae bacterium]MDY5370941.1 shikimate kinase [Eggerthellaceae bacterium]
MAKKSNIVLIGMPGAGKSTLGVVLAKILGMDFVDGDILIQNQVGNTLQKIIDAQGVDGFLQVENDVLAAVDAQNTVISTGGSAIYSDEAMRHLTEIGTVVYLDVSLEELRSRLGSLHERGVVMRKGVSMSLDEIFEERGPLYRKYAEVTLQTDGLTVREATRKLVDALSVM